MLLLTTLTIGSREDVSIFAHLPPESRARLDEKAQALLAISSEKRIRFMVREIKQALTFRGLRGVELVDPSWLMHGIKGEPPRIVAAILVGLPGPVVRAIIRRLPENIRKRLPPKQDLSQAPVEVMRAVRHIFESRFHAMPPPAPSLKGFSFSDVIQLERNELFLLMRDLGLIELGLAFGAVGKLALAELARRLPRAAAEELIIAVRNSARTQTRDIKDAQRFLSRVVPNFQDTEEFFQKSGLWRLAKSSLAEDDAFRASFIQRLPHSAGKVFQSYVEIAIEFETSDETVLRDLQDSVLLRIRTLARRGQLNKRWAEIQYNFHTPPSDDEEYSVASAPPSE